MTMGEILVAAGILAVGFVAVLLAIFWPRRDVEKSGDGELNDDVRRGSYIDDGQDAR